MKNKYSEREINEIVYYNNYNRIAELSRIRRRNELQKLEWIYRISLHNFIANQLDKKINVDIFIDGLLDFNKLVKKNKVKSKFLITEWKKIK
jgi:hypothetical protein